MEKHKAPFYVATDQKLAGTPGKNLYECRYFDCRTDAERDCEGVPGSYVLETTRGLIWRSTIPQSKGA